MLDKCNKTKVLLLSPFFYPEPISTGKYNALLAKGLIENNCELEVWCSHPLYPDWEIEVSNTRLDGCQIIRGGKNLKYPRGYFSRRLVLEIWFLLFCLKQLMLNKKTFDVVIAIYPPTAFAFLLPFFKRNSTKVVGIAHDLQGLVYTRKFSGAKLLAAKLIKGVERIAFQNSDHVIFLSKTMQRVANDAYRLPASKSSVSYPFVVRGEFVDNGRLRDVLPDQGYNVVYSGALGEKQAPEKIVALFQELVQRRADIQCFIFSSGSVFEKLRSSNTSSSVHFKSLVSESDLFEMLLRSSIQLVPQEIGTSDGSLPSKVPNIIAAGTPLLCVADPGSELVELLGDYPLARVSTSWDQAALVSLVDDLLAVGSLNCLDDKEELLNMFSLDALVSKIRRLAEGVV
jgi:glycosyltransferase involved in cell wall biosynthesis